MAPFYKGWEPKLKLDGDDIKGIQALYGEPDDAIATPTVKPSSKPSRPPSRPKNNDRCSDPKIDTIFGTHDGNYYVFQGAHYWKLTDESVADGYPRKIADDWPGLPNNVDAAVTWTDNEKTYFFKGDNYWKFDNQQPQNGYPKKISQGFQGVPNDLDAGIPPLFTFPFPRVVYALFTFPFRMLSVY